MNRLIIDTNLTYIFVAAAALVWVWPANAHDHIQPELNSWYQSLYSEEGAWCCDGTDVTRLTDPQWMIRNGQYEVFLENEWQGAGKAGQGQQGRLRPGLANVVSWPDPDEGGGRCGDVSQARADDQTAHM